MSMRIYIHDEKTAGRIQKYCESVGLDVLTPSRVRELAGDNTNGSSFFLDTVDILLVEVTKPTQEIHFVLAQAILANKPTLCLYGKNQSPRELLSYIKKRKAPRPIKTYSYTDKTLEDAIKKFIIRYDPSQQEHDDIPSIKFTLRLTPRHERYLQWASEKAGLNKADFLREQLSNMQEEDDTFVEEEFYE